MDWRLKTTLFVIGLTMTVFMEQGVAAKLTKCVDKDGKVTFTQMGCSIDETKKRIHVESSPNTMDRMSGSARSALQKTSQQRQKRQTRTISKKRVNKRCKRR